MNHLLTHATLVICSDVGEEVCCFRSSVLRTPKHLVDRHNMGNNAVTGFLPSVLVYVFSIPEPAVIHTKIITFQ